MQNNIRNTNLRFNLDKEQQRRAWEYLQTMDRQDFKSYSQVISLALVDYFDRYYRTQADPYLETREQEELFVKQIVDAVEYSGIYYRIGKGHKEFIPDKAMDEEYYLLTLMAM